MYYRITIDGETPLIMHDGGKGIDTRSPENLEKKDLSRKKGNNRTAVEDARIAELETLTSFWTDERTGAPTIPASAIRRVMEDAARKLKEGPAVREGFLVHSIVAFDYDRERYGSTMAELGKTCQFSVGVVVQKSRLLRTRAKFDTPWSLTFLIEVDKELIDEDRLRTWLDIAGRRLGLGDWRPQKSGFYGRFNIGSLEEADRPTL